MNPLKLVVIVLLVSMMLQTGTQLNRERLKDILKDRSLLVRALLVNVVLVPIFGLLTVRALHLQDEIATGVLLMAIAPGLPLLPRRAGPKIGGSLNFAVLLTFMLPLVSIITAPLTAHYVLPAGYSAHLPFRQFLTTLVLFELIPLLAGVVLAQTLPSVAKALERPLTILFVLLAVVFVVMAAPTLYKAVSSAVGTFGILAALIVVLLSFGAGYLFGGPDPAYRNTLAIGSGMRNLGLAAVAATVNFPGSLVVAVVLSYFLVQLIVASILGAYLARTTHLPQAPATAG